MMAELPLPQHFVHVFGLGSVPTERPVPISEGHLDTVTRKSGEKCRDNPTHGIEDRVDQFPVCLTHVIPSPGK